MKINLIAFIIVASTIGCVQQSKVEEAIPESDCSTVALSIWQNRYSPLIKSALNKEMPLSTTRDLQGAIADLNKAIEIVPSDPWAFQIRAGIKKQLGDYRGAIIDYNMAIKLDTSNSSYYEYRGDVKLMQLKYKEASDDFTKSTQLDENNYTSYFKRGEVKSKNLNNYKGAIEDYSLAIEICNNEVKQNPADKDGNTPVGAVFARLEIRDYYLARGNSQLKIGDIDKACLDFSKAGELGEASAYELIRMYCN